VTGGGEHRHHGVHWIRLFLDLFSEGEAIHVGHVPIQQNKPETAPFDLG
jgi:hypothetical protein